MRVQLEIAVTMMQPADSVKFSDFCHYKVAKYSFRLITCFKFRNRLTSLWGNMTAGCFEDHANHMIVRGGQIERQTCVYY